MYYVLLDSTGNLIASYREEDEARAALAQLVTDDVEAAEDVALMTYDDEGAITSDPTFIAPTIALTIRAESPDDWYGGAAAAGDLSYGTHTGQLAEPVG